MEPVSSNRPGFDSAAHDTKALPLAVWKIRWWTTAYWLPSGIH